MKSLLHFIGGPTASGKSALAVEIALRENGEIINADAMQVYRGLPILTAQPEPEMKKAAPHNLFEIVDPSERFSVGKWLEIAAKTVDEVSARGKTPILVGGTGLYFKSLEDGLAQIPPIPEPDRAATVALYDKLGTEEFRANLATLDPESAAKLKPNDKQRLIRAYEVVVATGQPLAFWHSQTQSPLSGRFEIIRHPIMPDRSDLYARCDKRFAQMIDRGAIDEVRALMAKNLSSDLPAMKILGVPQLMAALRGEMKMEEAIVKAQQTTRNYAKRQVTWFKNQWN
jgi:tRNA dimethylallyltransferase